MVPYIALVRIKHPSLSSIKLFAEPKPINIFWTDEPEGVKTCTYPDVLSPCFRARNGFQVWLLNKRFLRFP